MRIKLSAAERKDCFDALNYMNIKEIKNFCQAHGLPATGKKGPVLARIQHYLVTGEILKPTGLPTVSKAVKGREYPLKPSTRILKGAYKNDTRTRIFLKSLVGDHFHFTAFGQDWIMHRWQQGKPPTYAEFARAWEKEYASRSKRKATPKQEWAYLNFLQRCQQTMATASKQEVATAWKQFRAERVKAAKRYLAMVKTRVIKARV